MSREILKDTTIYNLHYAIYTLHHNTIFLLTDQLILNDTTTYKLHYTIYTLHHNMIYLLTDQLIAI